MLCASRAELAEAGDRSGPLWARWAAKREVSVNLETGEPLTSTIKKHRHVLIALGWYDYRLHRGIEKYAQEHAWSLSANLAREKLIPWGWEGDGILAWLGAWDELAEFVERENKPTVDFSFRRPHLQFPRVLEDHAQAAQLVADHYLARGFTHFAYYSDSTNWSYDERGQGFVEALQRAGHTCLWLKWHQSPAFRTDREQWKRKQAWLAAQLKEAPKPLALFAANDQHALNVAEACEAARLVVPDQVAIVGAENYLLEPIRIPAAGLIVRKSSDLLAVRHPGVARSLRFIWDHCQEPISVKDLVGVAAMSRRGLHKAFLEHLGRTPGQELHRVRIELAKKLLAESRYKLEVLAGMCGYQSANSFCVAFKQTTGMAPKQYRDRLLG
jgi:LacI family transcriptional regulator